MRLRILLVISLLGAGPAAAQEARPWFRSQDGWASPEKPLHLGISAALVGAGYGAGRVLGLEPSEARVLGILGSTGIGVWKEWHDYRTGGWADPVDLVWDAGGIVLGAWLTRQWERWRCGHSSC